MRSLWLVSIMALAVSLEPPYCGMARPAQNHKNERDKKVLQIQELIERDDLVEASRLLAAAAEQYPADEGFDNLRGIVEAKQGQYQTAEKSFLRAIARAPKFTGAYLNLGRLYQEDKGADPQAPRKALEVYRRVLAYEATNAEANYQSALLFLRQGDYQKSLDHVLCLPLHLQKSAQALSIRCADYAGLGNRQSTDEAAAQLRAASDFSEADAQQALLGLIPAKREDLIVSLLEGLQSRGQLSAALLHALGLAYGHLNQLEEARATLEKSFVEGKASVALLLELTRIARLQKDYQGALGYLAHAQDMEPNNARLHYDFGVVCVDLNLIAEARNSFEKALKLEPENPEYNYAMGAASAFQHDPAQAVPYFKKYLKLRPRDPRGKLAVGAALFRAKDFDNAVPWLKESAEIPQTAAKAHYYLGVIALGEGRLDEALNKLQQVLKTHPDDPDALAELGNYYLIRKDYGQAEKQIEHALKIDQDHYAANFYLLTLYTRTKDAKQEAQAKRFEELRKLLAEKTQEFLRIVEVRPLEVP